MVKTTSRLHQLTADLSNRTGPKSDAPEPNANQPEGQGVAVQIAPEPRFPPVQPGGASAKPKTGPGQMLQFRSQMLASEDELSKLREQLKQYDGSIPAVKLDPTTVHRSKWANRDAHSFKTAAFAKLKSEIEAAGGNVQPILVRQITGKPGQYEIVFGHRRWQACLELALPVLALIVQIDMPDAQLFISMDRENRGRADLSPYEQGRMYSQALEEGLFPSARQLADSLGVSNAWVSKTMSVAQLPAPVLDAFANPLEIQPAQARDINKALEQDRKSVLKRAEKARGQGMKTAAVAHFLATGARATTDAEKGSLTAEGKVWGVYQLAPDGAASFKLTAAATAEGDLDSLTAAFRSAVEAMRGRKP